MEWTNIDLASKLSLICGSNVNYYKSVHQPIPTLLVGKGNTLSLLFSFGQTLPEKCLYSVLFSFGCGKMRARITPNKDIFYAVKQKRRGRPFLEGIRRGPHCAITLKTIWLL